MLLGKICESLHERMGKLPVVGLGAGGDGSSSVVCKH